jgi:hypothetical protein
MPHLANEDGWRQARELFMRLAIQLHSLKWFTLYAAETAQDSFRFSCKIFDPRYEKSNSPNKILCQVGYESKDIHHGYGISSKSMPI